VGGVAVLVDAAGAAQAAVFPVGVEHVVVDDELVSAFEEVKQRPRAAAGSGEAVILGHLDDGQAGTGGGELALALVSAFSSSRSATRARVHCSRLTISGRLTLLSPLASDRVAFA